MPSRFLRKSFKSVCIDTVLFFAMFALVGHITINYWERYTIQNELYSMKHSLHNLKNNIGNIGKAYDTLHTQLKGLIQEVDKKQMDTPECRKREKMEAKCKAENNINKMQRDYQVQTAITKSNKIVLGAIETDNNKKPYGHEHKAAGPKVETDNNIKPSGHEHKATGPKGTNASTNTRNPPKSTGTTSSDISNDKDNLGIDEDYHHNEKDYSHNEKDYSRNQNDYSRNERNHCRNKKDYQHSKTYNKDFDDRIHVCHRDW